jgi:hypothetical protein
MEVKLITGEFNAQDSLDIITQMIQIKIKYHENKINNLSNEEDIKSREKKIKELQNELYELRNNLHSDSRTVKLDAVIHVNS